jgi:hypothetical protein
MCTCVGQGQQKGFTFHLRKICQFPPKCLHGHGELLQQPGQGELYWHWLLVINIQNFVFKECYQKNRFRGHLKNSRNKEVTLPSSAVVTCSTHFATLWRRHFSVILWYFNIYCVHPSTYSVTTYVYVHTVQYVFPLIVLVDQKPFLFSAASQGTAYSEGSS